MLTLADKGIYKVGAGTLFNVTMGGLSLFALAWIYFDSVGNAKPKSRHIGVLVGYWLGHIAILWSAGAISVALAGEVYVGLREPYPEGYGALGSQHWFEGVRYFHGLGPIGRSPFRAVDFRQRSLGAGAVLTDCRADLSSC